MARVIFWDVDTQYDFMHADGKLYVPEAERIITNLQRLTNYAHGHGIRIVASADDHVMGHSEISDSPDWQSTFPAHCMRGTAGQMKIPETALRDPLVIEPARAAPKARIRSARAFASAPPGSMTSRSLRAVPGIFILPAGPPIQLAGEVLFQSGPPEI